MNVSQLDFPNENVYGMYQSHDWLAKFFFADDAGAGRELNGVDASKVASNPNSGKDGTCNFCGGRGDLILKEGIVEKLLSTISATLGADKNKFIGYAIQTSCSEIQDALNKNVKGIKKGECITLKGVYSVLSHFPELLQPHAQSVAVRVNNSFPSKKFLSTI